MLTVYERYAGDPDWFARAASKADRAVLSDDVWRRLDKLVRDVAVVEAGLGAAVMIERTNEALEETFADESTRHRFRKLAVRLTRPKRWWEFWK